MPKLFCVGVSKSTFDTVGYKKRHKRMAIACADQDFVRQCANLAEGRTREGGGNLAASRGVHSGTGGVRACALEALTRPRYAPPRLA